MNWQVTDPKYVAQVIRLKDLDAPGGQAGCGLTVNGELCKRCKGKGWFQFAEVGCRYTCPDCFVDYGPEP